MNFKKDGTFIVFIAVLALFSGCIKSEDPRDLKSFNKADALGYEEDERNATFYIDKTVRAERIGRITSYDGEAKDVRAINYQFTVCFRETDANTPLRNGFDLEVRSPEGETPSFSVDKSTEPSGCIRWQEKFKFDIGKKNPKPVLFLRKIKAAKESSRPGTVSLVFQLFPWAEILDAQEHPAFYYIHLDQRLNYKGQVQRLFSGNYNPKEKLKAREEERVRLVISAIDYRLTGLPFSVIKKDLQPTKEEIVERGPKVLDLSTNYVMNAEINNKNLDKHLANLENNNQSPYAEVKPEPDFDGLHISLMLKLNLAQIYSSLDGPRPRKLRTGRFKILPYLYATNYNGSGERVLLNPGMEAIVDNADSTKINEKGDLNVHYEGILPFVPTSGNVKLALQITPLDSNISKYAVVEEIFDIGNYMSLIGESRPPDAIENFDLDFDFVKYAKGSSGYDEALANSHLVKAEPYNFTLAQVRFKTIDPGETANRRTVIFNVNTCVSRLNSEAKIAPGQEYEVVARYFKSVKAELKDENLDNRESAEALVEGVDYKDVNLFGKIDGDKIRADAKGCLNFTDKIRHKYYRTERLMRRKYFIRAKDDVQNFTKELVLYLNPWDEKFGTLGTDARSVSQTFLSQLNKRDKIVPRFYIQDFRYETLRFRYEVDKNMNLVVKKTVLFRAYPRVMRYSNVLQGINSIFPIRDGIYLMKIAYQKDYLDPAADKVRKHAGQEKQTIQLGYAGASSIQRVVQTPLGDDKTKFTTRVLKTNKQSEKDEAYAASKDLHLDGSHKVIPPYDPGRKTALSIVKKLIRVNSGAIVTPVEFSIRDLRLLRIRAQMFVQIEPINQTRLQLVNMASEAINKVLQLKKGSSSPISSLPKDEQIEIIRQKTNALDILAGVIPDDLEYTKEDPSELEGIFKSKEVVEAFAPFFPGGALSSVQQMLKRGGKGVEFLQDAIASSFADKETYLEQLRDETQSLKMELTKTVENRNYDVETLTNLKGEDVDVYTYKNSDEFLAICGKSHTGYDKCVADNTSKDANFNAWKCHCYDRLSEDHQTFSTKAGDLLTKFEEAKENGRTEFFSSLSDDTALSKLLLNDFTLAQAEADISDLDLLKDVVIPRVDIDKRTFVGPLTFLNNSNGGALRPTDNLDEAYCVIDDCNSLATDPLSKYSAVQNFDYERSPYHGSIAHFAGKHVDDFIKGGEVTVGDRTVQIPSYKDFRNGKNKEVAVNALLSNFVDNYNLNYVSLKNKKLKAFVCDNPIMADFENNKNGCFVDYTKRHLDKADLFETFDKYSTDKNITRKYKSLNKNGEFNVDLDFLSKTISKKHGGDQCTKKVVPASYADFDEQEYGKFCSLMVYGVFAKNYSGLVDDFIGRVKNGEIEYDPVDTYVSKLLNYNDRDVYFKLFGKMIPNISSKVDKLYSSCLAYAAKGKFNEPLDIERKYRIEETGRYYYLGGKALNITLGQQIGISHKNDSNKLHKMDASAITRFIPASLKGYGYSYSRGEGVSANESLNIQQGTFLVMQNAEFDVELKKYEQCLVVRWSDDFLKKHKDLFYYDAMIKAARKSDLVVDGEPYGDQITRKMVEGLMLCSGEVENDPIAVRETYYYFTQHFTEGDMQDRADIHNHPWLLSLRGVREFETFIASTLSDHDAADKQPESVNVHAEELVGMGRLLESDLAAENLDGTGYANFDKFKSNGWPLAQLIRTYRKISPTFPGLYTQLNRREYQVDQWPWDGAEPGQKFEVGPNEGINCYGKAKENKK